MNAANRPALAQRVVVRDGAMGTQLQAAQLEGCNDTRPDVVGTKYVRLQSG